MFGWGNIFFVSKFWFVQSCNCLELLVDRKSFNKDVYLGFLSVLIYCELELLTSVIGGNDCYTTIVHLLQKRGNFFVEKEVNSFEGLTTWTDYVITF